jgi:uncharacterized protein (DUF4415 family)
MRAMRGRDIKLDETHPELDPKHIVRSVVRRGLKVRPTKEAISLRVDPEVLEWFRAQGTGWQTRMNDVLRAYKDEASRAALKAKE